MTSERVFESVTRVRARPLVERAIRITHAAVDEDPFPPDRPWLRHVLLVSSSDEAPPKSLSVEVQEGCTYVRDHEGGLVVAEAHPTQLLPDGSFRAVFRVAAGEGFYGWGEWFNGFRREQGRLKLRSGESPFFVQGRRTYSTVPFFLSSNGYGLLLLNSHTSDWRLDPRKGVLEVQASGPPADYIVIHGPAFRDILRTYTTLTGRPPLIPLWAFGLWGTSYPQEDQVVTLQRIDDHRRRKIPLDAVILDYHWEDGYHNFRWRRTLFPKPDEFLEALRARGVKLGLILTPFLNQYNASFQKRLLNAAVDNIPRGLERDDERALPEYNEAREAGYLACEDARWWFGRGGMVDFTNPEASRWWNERLETLYRQGVSFIKNDDGEYLPDDASSHLGADGREMHNLYGFFYSRAIYEGMAAMDNRRPLVYARSVWTGSQRFPAMFLGDQVPTFKSLRNTMRAGMNMSLAGFAYWTADLFGLNGKTRLEIHMRYAQWALMVPIARYFWRPPAVDNTRFPWSHGPTAEANFRRYAELRYRLLPYYYALAWEASQSGLPIMRPLVLEFDGDARAAEIWDQVMLGTGIMLAPIVRRGALERRVYLPRGRWYDFWSGLSWDGEQSITCEAPLDRLPMFVRGGTILPMCRPVSHITAEHRFEGLELHIWPTYPAEGTLYEDDGHTRAYEKGDYTLARVVAERRDAKLAVRLEKTQWEHSRPGDPDRKVEVVLHNTVEPGSVTLDGALSSDWQHFGREKTTRIPLSWEPKRGAEVVLSWRASDRE